MARPQIGIIDTASTFAPAAREGTTGRVSRLDGVRILFLSHSSGMYGASRQLLDLIEGLLPHGVVPIVGLSGEGRLGDALASRGIQTVEMRNQRWSGIGARFFRRYAYTALRSKSVAQELSNLGIDLVHSNTSLSALGALAAKRAGLPHVWHFHELMKGWLLPRSSVIRRIVAATIERTTHSLVTPSYDLAKRIRSYVPDFAIDVVPNGLLGRERPADLHQVRKPNGPFRLLVVGRPKGWVTALQCLQDLEVRGVSATLTFAGDGPERLMATASRAARELGVMPQVRFLGYVDDPSPLYRESDALLFPSDYESFGRVAVEAMAAGCPVIASRAGGLCEIVEDGRTGWLVDVRDSAGMAEAVVKLLHQPSLLEVVRRTAFEEAWDRYGIQRFGDEFAAIYRRCLVV